MPHDRNGRLVQKGDTVLVPMTVVEVYSAEDYCNVQLKIEGENGPGRITGGSLTLNARQVVLEEAAPDTGPLDE
jgi:hypothetical protein